MAAHLLTYSTLATLLALVVKSPEVVIASDVDEDGATVRHRYELEQYLTTYRVIAPRVTVAAFNVRRFGLSKLADTEAMRTLVLVLQRYELILVQEIVDKTQTVAENLTDALTAAAGTKYLLAISPRLGRQTFEQYAYIYRENVVELDRTEVYPDKSDVFEREPFIAIFNTRYVRSLRKLIFIGVHTQPRAAPTEIDALSDVIDYVSTTEQSIDLILFGDLNAACSYVTHKEWADNRLRHRTDLTWAIQDHDDTTVSASNCAYDRIILSGRLRESAIVQHASVYRYGSELNIPDELARRVSDHYPVQLLLPPVIRDTARSLNTKLSFRIVDRQPVSRQLLLEFTDSSSYEVRAAIAAGFTVKSLYSQATGEQESSLVEVRIQSTERPLHRLNLVRSLCRLAADTTTRDGSSILTAPALAAMRHKMSALLHDSSVYRQKEEYEWMASVTCDFTSQQCDMLVERDTYLA